MKLLISERAVYPWTQDNGICFRGYFIHGDDLYCGKKAIGYLKEKLENKVEVAQVLKELNGVFSIIWDSSGFTILAVDRLRGLPLFYCVADGELCVGDAADQVSACLPEMVIDPVSEEEYRATALFVTGRYTLLKGIYQVQAGSYCEYRPGGVKEVSYFHMVHDEFIEDREELLRGFNQAYQTVGKNLVKALRGRTAVIPLSGGADSRMVLQMLKAEGYEKILCFTYGRPGNQESKISRQVAEQYDCPWIMVPYTDETFIKMRTDADMRAYRRMACNFTSTPHLQDFPAVKWLHENGKIPEDGVFVPGHTGDLIAGGHITKEFLGKALPRDGFIQTIYKKFYGQVDPKKFSSDLRQKINASFTPVPGNDIETLAGQSIWFNIQERQAKFIVNSVRVYEYFGHEWLIPLWDNALFEFWRHVPVALRYKRKFYFEAIGQETVTSTNAPSANKAFRSCIRAIPVLRPLGRKFMRMVNYFASANNFEKMFPLKDFLVACLRGSELFTVNTLICYQQLDDCKELVREDEKT